MQPAWSAFLTSGRDEGAEAPAWRAARTEDGEGVAYSDPFTPRTQRAKLVKRGSGRYRDRSVIHEHSLKMRSKNGLSTA